eukprot:7150178-Pyramimonas_sp.AAC.1
MVEKGIGNVLFKMKRDKVESGDVLLVVEGRTNAGGGEGGFRRHLVQVIGSCFNPVVFDMARH